MSNPTTATIAQTDIAANDRHRLYEDILALVFGTLMVSLGLSFYIASGLLTGKHKRGVPFAEDSRMSNAYFASAATDENWDRIERLTKVAEDAGHTILELAICWLLSQEGVSSVLTGATKPEQVTSNVASSAWRLSNTELAAVAEALAG